MMEQGERPQNREQGPYRRGLPIVQARLLVGSATAWSQFDGEALNPENTQLPQLTEQQFGNLPPRDYRLIQNYSLQEREETWRGRENNNFDDQLAAWEDEMAEAFRRRRTFFRGNEGKEQKQFYDRVFGLDVTHFNQDTAHGLYQEFLGSRHAGGGVMRFMNRIVNSDYFRSNNGSFNRELLERNLGEIEWLAGVFGQNSRSIVTDIIDAEVKYHDNERGGELYREGVQNINRITQGEDTWNSLNTLWTFREEQRQRVEEEQAAQSNEGNNVRQERPRGTQRLWGAFRAAGERFGRFFREARERGARRARYQTRDAQQNNNEGRETVQNRIAESAEIRYTPHRAGENLIDSIRETLDIEDLDFHRRVEATAAVLTSYFRSQKFPLNGFNEWQVSIPDIVVAIPVPTEAYIYGKAYAQRDYFLGSLSRVGDFGINLVNYPSNINSNEIRATGRLVPSRLISLLHALGRSQAIRMEGAVDDRVRGLMDYLGEKSSEAADELGWTLDGMSIQDSRLGLNFSMIGAPRRRTAPTPPELTVVEATRRILSDESSQFKDIAGANVEPAEPHVISGDLETETKNFLETVGEKPVTLRYEAQTFKDHLSRREFKLEEAQPDGKIKETILTLEDVGLEPVWSGNSLEISVKVVTPLIIGGKKLGMQRVATIRGTLENKSQPDGTNTLGIRNYERDVSIVAATFSKKSKPEIEQEIDSRVGDPNAILTETIQRVNPNFEVQSAQIVNGGLNITVKRKPAV